MIIQAACSECGADGWRIGMSASEMTMIFKQMMKLNQMMCPRSASTSAYSCRWIKGRASQHWSLVATSRAKRTHLLVWANPQRRRRSIQNVSCRIAR